MYVQLLTSLACSPSMVTLEVGSCSEDPGIYKLHVHESILCELDFFKAALQGGFKEASTKVIKMPEDDPVLMASFVEFLYRGSYREPVPSEQKDDGAPLKELFTKKLYHARVLALAEKYTFQDLCNKAASSVRVLHTNIGANATAESDAYFLEYIVQLYEMSGPGSALRIPKTEDTASSPTTSMKPIVWNMENTALWIGRMWKNAAQRPLVEEAFERCSDLAQDLLIMIADGFVDKADCTAKGHSKKIRRVNDEW